jgi:tetratricopeptide (TPR) repeat protein
MAKTAARARREPAARRAAAEETVIRWLTGERVRRLGSNDEALAEYNRAIEAGDEVTAALVGRAAVLSELGHNLDAVADCDWVIEREPDFGIAYGVRGKVLIDLGRLKEAKADINRALELYLKNDALRATFVKLGESISRNYNPDIMDDRRAEFHALADEAFERGIPIERFREAIKGELAATEQKAAHETTDRADLSVVLPQSHKEKLTVAKKLITGKLPPLFARQRARRKPGKPSVVDEARRIAGHYERNHGKMIYDDQAMSFVQAANVILAENKMKSQRSRAKLAGANKQGSRSRNSHLIPV